MINFTCDSPQILQNLSFRVPNSGTRCHDLFYVPKFRINVRKFSPLVRLMSEFNEFSRQNSDVDFAMPESIFKKYLKQCIN